MSYKTELHCHTSLSGCSNVPAAEAAEKYIAAGYTTLVVTNHYTKYYRGDGTVRELARRAFAEAEAVREAAAGRLNVLTGMEVTFGCMPNDFLVYGMSEEDFAGMDDIFDLRPGHLRERLEEIGGVIIGAHPFRFGMTVVNPVELDGIEVFNGHPGHHSHNDIAKLWSLMWAEHYRKNGGFILTSGSDHHYKEQVPNGGIETDEPITTMEQLVQVLKSGKYNRIVTSLGEMDF